MFFHCIICLLLSSHTQSERRHGQHQKCTCPDPSLPLQNPDKEWKKHHARLVEDAKRAPNKLDIVFLGDEIIEQWNGTADMGTTILKGDMREPFEKRFTTKGGGTLEGLALGSSIDTVRSSLVCTINMAVLYHPTIYSFVFSSCSTHSLSVSFGGRAPTCFGIYKME